MTTINIHSKVTYLGADIVSNRADNTVGKLCTGTVMSIDYGAQTVLIMPDHRTVIGSPMYSVRVKMPIAELNPEINPELVIA